MTITEVIVIVSGLALGYWLVGVFLPHARSRPEDDADAAAERDAPPGDGWGFGRDRDHRAWHEVLEVDRDASHEEVAAAYKRRIAQYHPDKVATMAPEIRELAERRSAAINAAYDEAMRQLRA